MQLISDSRHQRVFNSWSHDLISAALGLLLTFGLISDNIYQARTGEYSATAPWHWVIYSAMILVVTWYVFLAWRQYHAKENPNDAGEMRHRTGLSALPLGYGVTAFAVPLIGLAGVANVIWRLVAGEETLANSVLSPTHLGLAVGTALLLSAPWLSAWQQRQRGNLIEAPHWILRDVPGALSLGSVLTIIVLFLPYGIPYSGYPTTFLQLVAANQPAYLVTGVALVLFATIVALATMMIVTRHHRPLFGYFTLASIAPALAAGSFTDYATPSFVVLAAGLGLLSDFFVWLTWPQLRRRRDLLVIGAAWPLLAWSALLIVVRFETGLRPSSEISVGIPLIAAIVGTLFMLIQHAEQLPRPVEADNAANPFDDVISRARAMTERSTQDD